MFSSFSKVQGTSISISSHHPPTLRIPLSEKINYDFTLQADDTIKQFEDKVKTACSGSGLKNFKVIT
jgi:hypothetical protein